MDGTGSAAGALGRAVELEKAALRRSGWYGRYLAVFGAGQLFLVPMALLWRGPAAGAAFAVAQALIVGGLSLYAARQRVMRRGFGLRHGVIIGTWGVLFAATVVLGANVFTGNVAFAAAGALVCALPAAIGARLELRGQS
ncbi:hypothetical protein ACIGFK_16505 [Streptomyces sp. NPDC085524]|uniref:hypothetical protein n=1 Tax=unclassified Streptomyces TaxID=2593676 RepID=UPI00368E3068